MGSHQSSLQHHHYYLHHHHHYYQLHQEQHQVKNLAKSLKSNSKNKLKYCPTNAFPRPQQNNLLNKNNSCDDSCNATTYSETTTSSSEKFKKLKFVQAPQSDSHTSGNDLKPKENSNYKLKLKQLPRKSKKFVSSSPKMSTEMAKDLETVINHSLNEYEQACHMLNFDSNIDMFVNLIDMNRNQFPIEVCGSVCDNSFNSFNSAGEHVDKNGKSSVLPKVAMTLNSLNSFIQTINIPKYVRFQILVKT